MDKNDKLKGEDWTTKGFNQFGMRPLGGKPETAKYIGGANFDVLLDELLFNRMIRLKNLSQSPQGNDPGKIYWDAENKKFKMWVDAVGGWVDIVYTSTSTSTTTTSSSSTSISTTTTSSSSISTSSTSISTTTV